MLPKHRAPSHPGSILQEDFLTPMGITQTALAAHLDWSHAKVNELVKGKRGVTPAVALGLADALGTAPELWLNLQNHYDLWHALRRHEKLPRLKRVLRPALA